MLDDDHQTLKSRAQACGLTLTEYVPQLLERSATRPTPDELTARIRERGFDPPSFSSVTAVHELRDAGER